MWGVVCIIADQTRLGQVCGSVCVCACSPAVVVVVVVVVKKESRYVQPGAMAKSSLFSAIALLHNTQLPGKTCSAYTHTKHLPLWGGAEWGSEREIKRERERERPNAEPICSGLRRLNDKSDLNWDEAMKWRHCQLNTLLVAKLLFSGKNAALKLLFN